MDKFYIIANRQKQAALQASIQIQEYLKEKGKTVYIQDQEAKGRGYRYTDPSLIPADTECVMVLGGDGTLLQASRDLVETSLPLLGVNLGTLGYLAEIDMNGVRDAIDHLIEGTYSIEKRMMLSGNVLRAGRCVLQDIALNDIVIGRRGPLRIIDFRVFVGGTFLSSYRADGMIISTATGSTGYSLSAGGPIVSPEASLMLLTAIAPHTLNARPIVLPDDVEIAVEITGGRTSSQERAEATFDGDTSLSVEAGDIITIRKAQQYTKLIKIHDTSFVQILRKKMN